MSNARHAIQLTAEVNNELEPTGMSAPDLPLRPRVVDHHGLPADELALGGKPMKSVCVRAFWALSVFCVAIAVLCLLIQRGPSPIPPGTVSLTFVGFTNDTVNGLSGLFTISNCNPWHISYRAGLPQIKTSDSWSAVQVTPGPGITLTPRQASSFVVYGPANGEAWKVPVVYGKRRGAAEFYLWRARVWYANHFEDDERSRSLALPAQTNFTPQVSR